MEQRPSSEMDSPARIVASAGMVSMHAVTGASVGGVGGGVAGGAVGGGRLVEGGSVVVSSGSSLLLLPPTAAKMAAPPAAAAPAPMITPEEIPPPPPPPAAPLAIEVTSPEAARKLKTPSDLKPRSWSRFGLVVPTRRFGSP